MFRGGKSKAAVNRRPLHIRTGDQVIVLSGEGRDRKTPRTVLGVLPREGKVLVEGVNVMKDSQKGKQGGPARQAGINEEAFIEKPYPIHRSKVALVDPKTKKATRVKIKQQADGKRVRVASGSGETIERA